MFFFGSSKPVHDTWLAQLPPANASTTEFRRWIAVWGADSGRSKEIQKIRPSLWWGDTIRALTDSQMHEQLQAHGLERTIALSLAHDIERAKLLEMRKFTDMSHYSKFQTAVQNIAFLAIVFVFFAFAMACVLEEVTLADK